MTMQMTAPGIKKFVDELLATQEYAKVQCSKALVVLKKLV